MEQKSTKNRGRRLKIPFSAFLTYLLLCAIALSGVTFSRFVTATTVGNAARVAYMKDITVSESGGLSDPESGTILPGADLKKNFTVRFAGSEMACYVFIRIRTVGWEQKDYYAFSCPIDGTDALGWSVDRSVWTFLNSEGGDAVYYCIVRAKEPLTAEVLGNGGSVTVGRDLTRTQLEKLNQNLKTDLSVSVEATAMQYHGLEEIIGSGYSEAERAAAAWNLVKAK